MAIKMDSFRPDKHADISALKAFIRTFGKRAQSRHKALGKAYGPGGSLEGSKSILLEKYPKMDTKTKGLSRNALLKKATDIFKFLSAKTSTVAGVKAVEAARAKAFETKEKKRKVHEKNQKEYKQKKGTYTWTTVVKIMGKLQQAGLQGEYDSNETYELAKAAASEGQTEDTILRWMAENKFDSVHDWFVTQSWEDIAGTYGEEDLDDVFE